MVQNPIAYIICESVTQEPKTRILQDCDKTATVTIETVLQSFGCLNWNQRIYESGLVIPAMDNDPLIQLDMKMGTWYGEYGHPLSNDLKRQVTIDPKCECHSIDSYRTEGNLLVANVTTLPKGYGYEMRNMILAGKPAMFSLRALGSVDMATKKAVSPLKVITYDSVTRPSHKEAYQRSIIGGNTLTESVYIPLTESNINAQIFDYVSEKSENVKRACDLFDLTMNNCSLNGKRAITLVNESVGIRVIVPIERAINMQYRDIIKF
jgi:hypothetical protein